MHRNVRWYVSVGGLVFRIFFHHMPHSRVQCANGGFHHLKKNRKTEEQTNRKEDSAFENKNRWVRWVRLSNYPKICRILKIGSTSNTSKTVVVSTQIHRLPTHPFNVSIDFGGFNFDVFIVLQHVMHDFFLTFDVTQHLFQTCFRVFRWFRV